jgi:hypothetical protein
MQSSLSSSVSCRSTIVTTTTKDCRQEQQDSAQRRKKGGKATGAAGTFKVHDVAARCEERQDRVVPLRYGKVVLKDHGDVNQDALGDTVEPDRTPRYFKLVGIVRMGATDNGCDASLGEVPIVSATNRGVGHRPDRP